MSFCSIVTEVMSDGLDDRLAMWAMMDLPMRQLAGSNFCLRESLRMAMVLWPSLVIILMVGIMYRPLGRVLWEHGCTSTVDSGCRDSVCVGFTLTCVVRWEGRMMDRLLVAFVFPFYVYLKGRHAVYDIFPEVRGLFHVHRGIDRHVTYCGVVFLLFCRVFAGILFHGFVMGSLSACGFVQEWMDHF